MICDVSKHQGSINWERLYRNLDFVVIKASGKVKDPYFDRNARECERYKIPMHVYHFLYCTTVAKAKAEAKLFSDSVGSYEPLFWVLDCEKQSRITAKNALSIVTAFEAELRRLRGNDIRIAIYIAHELYMPWKLDYGHYAYIWIPRYGDNDGTIERSIRPDYPCDIWQYTSHGRLPGIGEDVDLDVLTGTKPLSFFTSPKEAKKTDDAMVDGGDNSMATNYKKYINSSGTHYISNSGSDENGKYKGGVAGDQTGKEYSLKAWYNRPWTCVLRWIDIKVGTLLAELGIDAALNNKIGYDQYQRDSYWKQLKAVGYLPSRITVPCEEDCTAGVNANVHAAAYLLGIPALKAIPETGVRSSNMRKHYSNAGFKVLTDSKYLKNGDYLLPGDILLYDNHHACINVTAGKKVSYVYESVITQFIDKSPVTSDLKRGDSGPEVKAMQDMLLKWKPDCLPRYGADGDFGGETEDALKAFQKASNLKETGIYDAATEAALKAVSFGHVLVTGGSVNVRSAPGYDSKVYGTAHKDDLLIYQGQKETLDGKDWYCVVFKSQVAWISSKYAKLVE